MIYPHPCLSISLRKQRGIKKNFYITFLKFSFYNTETLAGKMISLLCVSLRADVARREGMGMGGGRVIC